MRRRISWRLQASGWHTFVTFTSGKPIILLVQSQERPALDSGRTSRRMALTKCTLHNKNVFSRGKNFTRDFPSCLLWISYLTFKRKEAKKPM